MISVIISIYKRLDNLSLILAGLAEQTFKDFEVIISEDNNAEDTIEFVKAARKQFDFEIKHISQEDKGFRKTKALNQAVLAAKFDYLVFLDGDCIPHKKLLETYRKHLNPTTICVGRRCYLDRKITDRLHSGKNLKLLSFVNILIHAKRLGHAFYTPTLIKPKVSTRSRSIIGCNWGIYKQNVLDVNGFDEDYLQAGEGEDFDIDWRLRLLNKDFIFLNVKHEAITYHLYHDMNYTREQANISRALKLEKMKEGHFFCKNGIEKA